MKRTLGSILVIAAAMTAMAAAEQSRDSLAPPAGFPEELLEGASDFGLAIFMQGDLRGNFGPCG